MEELAKELKELEDLKNLMIQIESMWSCLWAV